MILHCFFLNFSINQQKGRKLGQFSFRRWQKNWSIFPNLKMTVKKSIYAIKNHLVHAIIASIFSYILNLEALAFSLTWKSLKQFLFFLTDKLSSLFCKFLYKSTPSCQCCGQIYEHLRICRNEIIELKLFSASR